MKIEVSSVSSTQLTIVLEQIVEKNLRYALLLVAQVLLSNYFSLKKYLKEAVYHASSNS